MSTTIFTRGAILAAATLLALTACGGAEEAPAQEERDGGTDSDDTDTADSGDSEEGGDTAAAEPTVVEIGTEFEIPAA